MVASLAYYWDSIWYNITKNKYGLETCLEPLIYCQSTLQQVVRMPVFIVDEEWTPSNEL